MVALMRWPEGAESYNSAAVASLTTSDTSLVKAAQWVPVHSRQCDGWHRTSDWTAPQNGALVWVFPRPVSPGCSR